MLCLLVATGGCVKEMEPGKGSSSGQDGEAWCTLDFGADIMPVVSTRASAETENQLFNFYLFIFDMNNGGKKVYGRMFDTGNRTTSANIAGAADECWYVEYAHKAADGVEYPGGGSVKVKAPLGKNFNIYMIGNLDADMIRISSDLLSHTIDSEEDLRNFEVLMNQEVVSRNGYFPMSGSLRGVEVEQGADGDGEFKVDDKNAILQLLRFDAKIEFTFKFNASNIKSFEAKQWKVVNVPKTAYVLSYDERGFGNEEVTGQDSGNVPVPADGEDLGAYYSQYASRYFDTDFVNFEDVNTDGESKFVFYMLPNRLTPKHTPKDWNERDRQVKTASDKNLMANVSYITTSGETVTKRVPIFENANDFSTYVVVTGRVDMELDGDQAGQVLGADVQYLIHLGDWTGGAFDNFNVRRNNHYKYTVTINNVDNIRVEVETSKDGQDFKENQPGAIGEVVIAKEEIAVCDAHYTTKTMTFHLSNFYNNKENIAENLIWTVQTPFVSDDIVQDGGVPKVADYQWAHFRINKRENEKADGSFTYSGKMRKYTPRQYAESTTYRSASDNKESDGSGADGVAGYHNDGIMDIITLVDYIKKQVALYEQYDKYGGVNTSAFDYSVDDKGNPDPVIKMTVFVDEYYYEIDPITHEKDPMLWKKFVNTKDRTMNILCDSNISKDGESKVTGSVITIQQHSIQTIYENDNPDLKTAWGLELTDEYAGELEWKKTGSYGNDSNENGLLNSVRLWELCGSANTSFTSGVRWDKYVDFEVTNDIPILKDDGHKDLRYSCFSRNRDNNGNGIIDRDEVRWYMASIQQLIGIYVGEPVLSKNVRLYNRSAADMASADEGKWMQHVVSSTRFDGGGDYPIIIWAEEGISTGSYSNNQDNGNANTRAKNLRCVRNLGYLDGKSDESYALDVVPQKFGSYVAAEDSESGNAYFDAEFLNKACFRYETSRELEYHHNNSIENRLVRRFEYSNNTVSSTGTFNFKTLNDDINEKMKDTGENPYCPEGYRLPNQRELAVLKYFTELSLPIIMSRTYWVFGGTEEAQKNGLSKEAKKDSYGFSYNDNFLTVSSGISVGGNNIRCVRDVHVD